MIISKNRTKAIIFNFTDKYQFNTQLMLKNENIEVVNKIKLLWTVITESLSWDENCVQLILKVNARMQLLRKCFSFGATQNEMVKLWILYCRSALMQSCVVRHSSLTEENIKDIERTQKTFCKLVLQKKIYKL